MKLINGSGRAAAFNQWQKLFVGYNLEERGAWSKDHSLGAGQVSPKEGGAAGLVGRELPSAKEGSLDCIYAI